MDYRGLREQCMFTRFAPFVSLPCQASAAKARPVVNTRNAAIKASENGAWSVGGRNFDGLEVLLTKSSVQQEKDQRGYY